MARDDTNRADARSAAGLSSSEVGKEIGEHAKYTDAHERRDQLISITEAVLLSVVALLAAWSGDAAAKWAPESRVEIATASSLRIESGRVRTGGPRRMALRHDFPRLAPSAT